MNRIRRRWAGTGLRTRLVLGLVTLTGLTMAVVGVALTLSLKAYLVDRIDDGLADRAPAHNEQAPDDDGDSVADAARSRGPGTVTFAVKDGTVTVQNLTDQQGQTVADAASLLDPADLREVVALSQGTGVHTLGLTGLGEYRVASSTDPDVPSGRLLLGTSLRSVDETVGQLVLVLTIAFGLALATVGTLGWLLIGRSLRPLRQVAATATVVAATPLATGDVRLEQRVPEADARTEVGQLGQAFNVMLAHVESSLQQRESSEERLRHFVGDASHELRTPIAAIRGWAELVRRAGPSQHEQAAVSAARIESAAGRMGLLVDDLLLLAQLDAGRPLASEPVDLRGVLAEAFAEARVAGGDQLWVLAVASDPVDPVVLGDPYALHHAVANLLGNARQHTPAGTTVTVRLEVETVGPGDERRAVITVSDDGPGIPPDLLPRVTERFARGDASRSRASGGTTGLGLAIAASIIEAHGGVLSVTSEAGTQARISLPALAQAPAPGEPHAQAHAQTQPEKQVLVPRSDGGHDHE